MFNGLNSATYINYPERIVPYIEGNLNTLKTNLATFEAGVEDLICPDCGGTGKIPEFVIENGVVTAYNGNGGNVVIPNGVTAIGDEAFRNNDTITSVTIPSTVTTIGQYAFDDCESLTGVTIPEGVTSIGEGAFWSTGLTEVTIPASVTEIGERAFYECSGLTSVTIPASVTTIGPRAFGVCSNLTDATLCWTNEDDIPTQDTNNHAFKYIAGEATLHVPKGMTQVYVDKGWGTSFYKGDDMNNIIDDVGISSESTFLTSFTLNKDYNDKYSTGNKTTAVNETVTYTVAPISTGDDVPAFTNSTFTITVTDGEGSADVALPTTITKTGDYWYSIQETGGKTAGVTYDTNTYYLHLITDCKNGEFGVVTAQIHVTEPDLTETDYEDQFVNDASDKIDTVSNSYGEGKLKITQDTKIDGEDNDYDEFEVTVTFTLPEGTEITGDITYGDNQKVTFDENGVGTAVITLKDGEYVTFDHIPDGTTYTVEQTDSNTDLGFGDPDFTIENGETDEDTVVTDETSGKETKVTGTISDGEDDITIANEMITPVDVGVILENGAFIILALGAIVLGAWLVISKRRKALDAE